MNQLDLSHMDKTVQAARSALVGERKGIAALLPFLGPAFIASIAYVDPGNFATNIQAGSQYGYKLLWVVLLANLMAMLFQTLSAKLGIATRRNLPELCRDYLPKWISLPMWIFSELAAMATDLAEFLGASLALNLLLGMSLLQATLLTGVATSFILMLEKHGFRPMEKFIAVFALLIGACYFIETFLSKPNIPQILHHSLIPWLGDSNSILLAAGVIGATVMPHAIYLHSGLMQNRIVPQNDREAVKIHQFSKKEVIIAMLFAGFINLAMMYMAAAVFNTTGHNQVIDIRDAYQTLTPLLGSAAASVFLISLLSSGISSSAVGTMAGQVIMQGFVGFTIPIWVRRIVTMLPTVIIVMLDIDPTQTLIVSQVVLSFVLPIPLISLIYFTKRKDLMGVLVNTRGVTLLASFCAGLIILLNGLLIWLTFQAI
jgi:manganese transport protein